MESKKEMPIDIVIESAKNDYAKAINEINAKYNLPIGIIESILCNLYSEVKILKITSLNQQLEDLKKESGNNGNKKDNSTK